MIIEFRSCTTGEFDGVASSFSIDGQLQQNWDCYFPDTYFSSFSLLLKNNYRYKAIFFFLLTDKEKHKNTILFLPLNWCITKLSNLQCPPFPRQLNAGVLFMTLASDSCVKLYHHARVQLQITAPSWCLGGVACRINQPF